MEVMSLEEDEYESMFITQSDRIINGNSAVISGESEKSDADDLDLPLEGQENIAMYSDISDAEDFQIPSSQVVEENER